jgi:hypothetical protein
MPLTGKARRHNKSICETLAIDYKSLMYCILAVGALLGRSFNLYFKVFICYRLRLDKQQFQAFSNTRGLLANFSDRIGKKGTF